MDTLELYRWAVRDPETHAEVLLIMHQRSGATAPGTILREDFAGSSADACGDCQGSQSADSWATSSGI